METTNNEAPTFSILSIISSILSWITLANAQYFVSFMVSIVGLISGVMAIRYYWYAGNEKRNQLK